MRTTSLRVGLVCPYSVGTYGGVQNHVLGLAAELRRRGHVPQVIAPGRLPVQLADHDFSSAGASVAVPYNGSVARVSFGPVSASRVRDWLDQGRFDLVHVHEPITPSISLLALALAEVPVVATYHTATPRSRTMQLAGRTLRRLVTKIDGGVAVSEAARSVVVQHLGRDAVVVPNGFDHGAFAAWRTAGTGPWRGGPRPRVSFLGRLDEPRKGLDVLLAALPQIRAAAPDLEVVVAGYGSRRLPDGVRVLGPLTETKKHDLLAHTDVFVAPHLARESFGIVLLEALASGAAVVASALPAFVDLLSGTGSPLGQLVPVGDAAALARAVTAMLRAPQGRRERQAGADVTARYDWSVVGGEITAVYQRVLAVGPAGRARGPEPADGRARAWDRARHTWAALDTALVSRARMVTGLADHQADPAVAGRARQHATDVLQCDLPAAERERAESDLSRALGVLGLTSAPEHLHATLARRLHNDAVAAARALERRGRGSAEGWQLRPARPFEMADH